MLALISSTAVGQTERLALEMCRALRDFGYEANICTFYFNERAGECADQQHKTYQKLTVLGGLPVGVLSSIKG